MVSVGQRIKKRRKQLKLSADRLGEIIGKNRATIYRYESDEIENMPYDVVLPISKALNVSPAWLMGWEEEEKEEVSTKYDFIPVNIAAGLPFSVESIKEDQVNKIEIPDALLGKWAGCKELFFTKVAGDSMNRVIPDKSIIAVKKVELYEINDNDIVVYSHNHEYSMKRFFNYVEEKKIVFRPDSTNPKFLDYVVDYEDCNNLKIHGKVVTYIVHLD